MEIDKEQTGKIAGKVGLGKMPKPILDYHYGAEAEQYAFFRIPKVLIKEECFKGVSTDAKLLYGLLLDRMSLSVKNGWLDEQNRVYIYFTLGEVWG